MVILSISFMIYTIWHANKYGEIRRLEYICNGYCLPPVTYEELSSWFPYEYMRSLEIAQEELGNDFSKVLNDNLWDLYVEDKDK